MKYHASNIGLSKGFLLLSLTNPLPEKNDIVVFLSPGGWSGHLEQKAERVPAKKRTIEIVKHSVRHPLNRLHGPTVRHDAPGDKHDLEVWPILGPVGKLGVDPGEALHPAQGGQRSGTIGNVLQHAWDVKEPLLPNADLNQQIRKW